MNVEETLVVIAYETDSAAQAARERLLSLSTEDLVELDVAAFVLKDEAGAVKVEKAGRRPHLKHLFGRSGDESSGDEVVQESAQALSPGQCALYLRVRSSSPEKVVPEISLYGGSVIMTSLPPERDKLLKEAVAQQWSSDEISDKLQS